MLRSLAYAAATARTPALLAPARAVFLAGWRSWAGALAPDESLLHFYELGHRPEWAQIPLRGLARL